MELQLRSWSVAGVSHRGAHMEKCGKLICVVICCITIEPGLRLQAVVAASVVIHLRLVEP